MVSIFGRLGDADTALALPNVLSTVWGWVEAPWGYWTFLGLGLVWLVYIVLKPEKQPKPTLDNLAKRIDALENWFSSMPEGVELVYSHPHPYIRVEFIKVESIDAQRLRVHFRVDTDISNIEVTKVILEISGEPIEASNWEPFKTNKTQTGIATFQLPTIISPDRYLVTLKVHLREGKSTGFQQHATEPFEIDIA